METPCSEPSLNNHNALPSKQELPPKKRISDKGKEVCNEPPQRNNLQKAPNSTEISKIPLSVANVTQNIDSQNLQKYCLNQEPQKDDPKPETTIKKDESEPSFNIYLNVNDGKKGESSNPSPLPIPSTAPPSRRPIACKFCGQQFSTTQALGGHQNAHRQEREIQKAVKAAQDFGTNPFLYSLPETLPGTLPGILRGSNIGHRYQYHPYNNGFAQRTLQARPPVYSHHPGIGLPQGPPGLGRALERFIGSSSTNPAGTSIQHGWHIPYNLSIGPTRRFNRPTNFNPLRGSNLTELQAMENQVSLSNKQRVESSGLNLSLMCTESPKMDLPPNCEESSKLESPMRQNESPKLDLNLKL